MTTHKETNSVKTLGNYPFDWSGLEDFSYPQDQAGVPKVDMGKNYGLQYNPITISQFGLFCLQKYAITGKRDTLQQALACANWLIGNFKNWRRDIGAWVYPFDLDYYGPKAPWISGMAQGQGISLLLRVHQQKQDERIPEITRRAFQAFLFAVEDGGVLEHFADGTPIFEEFTTTPPSRVLNGHIFALLGIYDYANFWNDAAAQSLFDSATAGLTQNLQLYDTGYWNLYDLHSSRRLASPMYMIVHIRLLRILAGLTGQSEFSALADKWLGYRQSLICRGRWFTKKMFEKLWSRH